MDGLVVTGIRVGILVVLWLFVLLALRAMKKDVAPKAYAGRGPARGVPGPGPSAPKRAPVTRMTVVDGPLRGSHMDISGMGAVTIGRSQDCDFVLGDDFSSARHARLFRRGSDWFVEDLDSRNGTSVGGVRIDQPERVGVGSDIRMGRSTVRLV
ncbi:FHA-domain-containing protein [Corynebacterium renale]|uniref:PSer/pThr/pTyr-binding forkhead associated (FHA) protein n=1 Tax=Corynebacterium renale TaxID=1724 RepID=A0A2A9DN61_9CORY|nr:FHA domain-containing protein [Corynebacterium renale]PFG27605.1 pSer/pThr/pTyr-binding forkhead associated (FHA) protein [Corynebacterium renale]SQG63689.1 FHA-domain-containing protein [Corynebacterium renale]SQI22826.1 FHA-domain-containing protein [Corynebacterium renale]STD01597.1 FHA-domain-containing protein [Corynebacterium renale]